MSRPLRIEYPGAWYHVMNRGQGRRWIYKTDEQRDCFISLLADTTDRFNAEWHAYCLMTNHYHLMLRTPDGNLQRIMRHVNGLYTQYFNRQERRDGPLFRGRYKAILVDAEAYWLQLSRYIHRNPLEAGLVQRLIDYRWSSYPAYAGKVPTPSWLTTHYVLQAIGQRNLHQRYMAFVAEDVDETMADFYGGPRLKPILGDDAYRERVLAGKTDHVDLPELRTERVVPTVDVIARAVSRQFGTSRTDIFLKTRGRGSRGSARSVTMYLCQRIGNMTLSEIAATFDLASYASASSTIRLVRQQLKENRELAKAVDYILLDLTPLAL